MHQNTISDLKKEQTIRIIQAMKTVEQALLGHSLDLNSTNNK